MTNFIVETLDRISKICAEDGHYAYLEQKFPTVLDEDISLVIDTFQAAYEISSLGVSKVVSGVSPSIGSCLRVYAHRVAEEAIKTKDIQMLRRGILALTLEGARDDVRETLRVFPVIYRSAEILGADPTEIFRWASTYASGEMAKILKEFPLRPIKDRNLHAMGLKEIVVDGVIRFRDITSRFDQEAILKKILENEP